MGAGKQKGTTSEAVRSPKPHVQSIAKNKVGGEQQKEIAEPSKVFPPTERNKAEKNQGAEIQKKTAGAFEDPCMQKKKANKKSGYEKPTETTMSSEVVGSQIIHENSSGEKKQNVVGRGSCCRAAKATSKEDKGEGFACESHGEGASAQGSEEAQGEDTSAPPNLSKASEQPVKRKLPLQAATLGSPSKRAKVESSGHLKSADLLLPSQLYVELYIDGKLVRMCRADLACPSRNTKMEKRTRMMDHLKKQHGLNVAIPTKVGGRVGGVSLNLVPKSSIRDRIRTQRFQEVDQKYEVNWKAVERTTVIKALSVGIASTRSMSDAARMILSQIFVASRMRKANAMQELKKDAIITKIRQGYKRHRRVQVGYVSTKDEDTAEDSLDQLEEYEKRRPTKQTVKVKKEEKASDLVKIYDSSDEEEVQEDQEEAEDEGGEEESGEEAEKSICQQEEKAKEEGRESDEENEDGSDGEKIDEGEGSIGDDEDSKDDGKGSGDDEKGSGDGGKGDSGDDGKGDEEEDRAESMDGSDEGDRVGASTDGSGSDERDGVGWTVEDEESTPEPRGGGGTPGVAVDLASMKRRFSLGLSSTSMEVIRFLEGNMY
ncbi:hypothetical protein L7F22_011414 [Adiantum nelumboides]|nr:hypothetical protein [Adiantum nelumboides]